MCSPDVLPRTRRCRTVPFSRLGCGAHEGTGGMVPVQHVLKRFPGQGPEWPASCRTDLNPHGSKDICKGSVEVNQTPRLGYKVSSIFLSPSRWIPWKKQKSTGFSTDGILHSSALLQLSELRLKMDPKTLAGCHSLRMSLSSNMQRFAKLTWLGQNKALEEKWEILFHYVFNILNELFWCFN